ncbi:hypothetical protein ACFWUZ_26625 [Streptomyces sp. NPDC058646]|uniref:hypothetical protein n=1 Tax=Streptomyces sp. NPDC058646 TaxID=3346574 RepID=UPI00364CD4C4
MGLAYLFVLFFELHVEGDDSGVCLGEFVLEEAVLMGERVGEGESGAQFFVTVTGFGWRRQRGGQGGPGTGAGVGIGHRDVPGRRIAGEHRCG